MRSNEDTIPEMGHLSFCGADSFQEHLGEGKESVGEGWQPRDTLSAQRKRKLRTRLEAEQRCPIGLLLLSPLV